jgi:4-amino-4-deoxy-L-arabinose transferase-like glycosyltransferase
MSPYFSKIPSKIFPLILLLLIVYFPLFLHLDTMPYRIWDESRLAVSAFEMLHTHNYWVVTFGDVPDLWSVKPPLMIWVIAISFKLLGYNALALRLPSALFGLATILVVYDFCRKDLRNPLLSFLSVFVLVTTAGYMDYHVTRTGDYDALLILCQTLFVIHFARHHFLNTHPSKNLYWSAFWLALALMTKGVAALFLLPSLVICLLLEGKLILYFKNKHTYIAVMIAFTPILAYFGWREHLSAGYLQAVWDMELFNRYLQGDGDAHIIRQSLLEKIEHYWDALYDDDFKPWLYLLPVSVISIYQLSNVFHRKILLFFLCNVLTIILLITFSSSKKGWYEAPIYPYLAILVGQALVWLAQFFEIILQNNKHLVVKCGLWSMIILFLAAPYWRIFKKFHGNTDHLYEWEQRQYTPFMSEIGKKMDYFVLQTGYNAAIEFVKKVSNEASSFKTHTMSVRDTQLYPKHIKMGAKVMCCEQEARDSLNQYFIYKTIDNQRTCVLVEITGLKTPP